MASNLDNSLKRKTILSLILGIVSISLFWFPLSSGLGFDFLIPKSVALISALFGLLLGMKGLKTTKKTLAIIGIILCSIGLLGAVYMFFAWLTVGGPTEL